LNTLLILITLALISFLASRHQRTKGLKPGLFSLIGLLLGPLGFDWMDAAFLNKMQPLIFFALAWIGLVVGMQVELKLWRNIGASLPLLAIGSALVTGLLSALPLFFSVFFFPGTTEATSVSFLMLAALAAPSFFSGSSFSRKAAAFPYPQSLARCMAKLDDLAALLLALGVFATLHPLTGTATWMHSMQTIGISLLLGLLWGVAFTLLVGPKADLAERLAIAIGMVALIAGSAKDLGVSPLIVGALTGAFLVNTNMAPKEKIYQVFVDAEHPIGLFVLMICGAMVRHISILTLFLGILWALIRFASRYLGPHLVGLPRDVAHSQHGIAPMSFVVLVSFCTLYQGTFSQWLPGTFLVGWLLTECTLVYKSYVPGWLPGVKQNKGQAP
jgi:hypothetical protein